MSLSSQCRERVAERDAFVRKVCRMAVVGLTGAVVLFIATLLVRVAWSLGGAL